MAEKTGRVSRQRSGPQELYSRKRVRKRQTEVTGLCWEPPEGSQAELGRPP